MDADATLAKFVPDKWRPATGWAKATVGANIVVPSKKVDFMILSCMLWGVYIVSFFKTVMQTFFLFVVVILCTLPCHAKPLMSLVMIVKNEARGIVATIASVRDVVDYYCIVDTGSSDTTVSLIRATFGATPGHVYDEPFVDFSTTRNRAIALEGGHSEFVLMLSGDEVLHNGTVLRLFLQTKVRNGSDAYDVQIMMGTAYEYMSTRLHRTARPWFYVGNTHEYLTNVWGDVAVERVPGVSIYHNVSANNKTEKHDRWLLDERLLLESWAETPSHRSAFLLGKTYAALQDWSRAYYWFELRSQMGLRAEEVYESRYQMAKIAERLPLYQWSVIEKMYLSILEDAPTRVEPLYELAYHYFEAKDYETSYVYLTRAVQLEIPVGLKVCMRRELYVYNVPDLLGTVAWFVNEMSVGRAAVLRALEYKPNDPRLLKNLAEYEAPGEL